MIHRSNYFTLKPTFVKPTLYFPGSLESSPQQNLPRSLQSPRSISTVVSLIHVSGRTFAFLHIRWGTETANMGFAEHVSNFKGKGEKKAHLAMLVSSGFCKEQRCSKSIPVLQTGQIPSIDVWAPCPSELGKQEKMCGNLLQGARAWLGAAPQNKLEQVSSGWGLERMLPRSCSEQAEIQPSCGLSACSTASDSQGSEGHTVKPRCSVGTSATSQPFYLEKSQRLMFILLSPM